MATYYVKSGATGSANGSSWTDAFTTLAAAAAVDVAGDTIYVSHLHSESGVTTFAGAGTSTASVKIICADDSATPPTGIASTAQITASTAYTVLGSAYLHGLNFQSTAVIELNAGVSGTQFYSNCSFYTTSTGSSGSIQSASTANNTYRTVLKDCTFRFSNANNLFKVFGETVINGGSADPSTATPTALFGFPTDRSSGTLVCNGFDFSNFASTVNLCKGSGTAASQKMIFRNCRLPAGWSGLLVSSGLSSLGQRFEMYNCDSGDTNYRLWVEDYAGSTKSETTITRSGGASDGVTPLSWRMAASARAVYPDGSLESPEIVVWNDTVGTAKTVTVEVLTDGVTLKDDECWLEVQYLGTAGYPLGLFASDAKADVLATAADQATSTETWTTTGLTTPVKQKLSVTFTPQEKGFVHAKVMLAKPSTTVYVCPKASVT